MRATSANKKPPVPVPLWELFWIFLRIASTSFGGFMAMISVVQNVVVERRKLLSHPDMLDGISLAAILPGPFAMNVVAYVGYRLRGGWGAFVCAFAAVLPAFVAIVLASVAYFRWGQLPAIGKLFMGLAPAVTAIIVAAALTMGRKAVTGLREAALALAASAALLGAGGFFSTLGIILVAGAVGWWWFRGTEKSPGERVPGGRAKMRRKSARKRLDANMFLLAGMPASIVPFLSMEPSILLKLFVTFAGMSLLLFGGGYVFIPLMQEIVVDGHGWVTRQEFIDAVAMGQIMPGPALVSAAFIGLKVAGFAGALLATIGIFAPSAIVMVLCANVLDRIRNSVIVEAALHGVRAAVVGMVFAAAVVIGKTAIPGWASAVIFVTALVALLRFRIEAVWVIPPAALIGYLVY